MNDQTFIDYLSQTYGIQAKRLPELMIIVRAMRGSVPAPGSPHRDKNTDFDRIIQAPVQTIHIETEEGVIHLHRQDPLFQYFGIAIKRVQDNFGKELSREDKKWQKKLSGMAEKAIFNFFDTVYNNNGATAVERDAVIGECLRHFEIYARTPIRTRDEWVEDMKSADTYPDYLHNIVKSRRKKLK
jgi:hypothetical protein